MYSCVIAPDGIILLAGRRKFVEQEEFNLYQGEGAALLHYFAIVFNSLTDGLVSANTWPI